MKQAMTKEEFISYAEEGASHEAMECIYERIAEIRSEIGLFGDSGPGTLYRLRLEQQQYNAVARQYHRLTGKHLPQFPALPTPR